MKIFHKKQCGILLLLIFLNPALAWAHHSTAIYDMENPVELQGKVVELQFTNPHTFIILAVENESGEEVVWSLEGSNTSLMLRRGWRPDTLKPGDEIRVNFRPLHSGAPGGNFREVKNPDGTPFDPLSRR
jgi:hypothetical protein